MNEAQKRRSADHDEAMTASLLADPGFAAQYITLSLVEGTQEEFLFALRRVVKAYGGIAKLAASTGLNENTLYRTLSGRGNPRLSTFISICNAMGMHISVSATPQEPRSTI